MKAKKRWNLNSLFAGESKSKKLALEIKRSHQKVAELSTIVKKESFDLVKGIQAWQELDGTLKEIESFIVCLIAQDTSCEKAFQLKADVTSLSAAVSSLSDAIIFKLAELPESECKKIMSGKIKDISFPIRMRIQEVKERLPLVQEDLIGSLSIDGYHSWHEVYTYLMGNMKIPYAGKEISCAQAENLLSSSDRNTRKTAFHSWKKVLQNHEQLFARILNHLSGFRLHLYEKRGWKSVLKEPLLKNHMKAKSLEAMWETVFDNRHHFIQFFKRKAQLLQIKDLSWFDLEAPLTRDHKSYPYDQAAELICESVGKFSNKIASFCTSCFEKSWIDAEERAKKAPGGFCVALPHAKESRIFLNYSSSFQNVLTLAHELGHAYHNQVVFNLPFLLQDYPMSLAEAASTVQEHLVLEGMLDKAKTKSEKLFVLHDKAQRSTCFFMNIAARFLFENSLYDAREESFLSAQTISSLMERAQKEAYGNVLHEYHPYFWISKQHFYFTALSFYNFPYTVGYLFSLAILSRAKEQPKQFASWYEKLLLDTGAMTLEDIAQKHFGMDLTKKTFWQNAINVAVDDVQQFLSMSR
jgi:pepF/M3 family oligoendopeptidase